MNTSDNSTFLERLFKDNYSNMEYFALKFFSNIDVAKEVVQDTFLLAQIKIYDLIKSPNPEGWLFNTLKNIIGDTYRKRKRLHDIYCSLEDQDEYLQKNSNLDIKTIYSGIISEKDLDLLIWIYCEELSYEAVSHKLGISLSACKKRIQRAKLKFRDAYENEKN